MEKRQINSKAIAFVALAVLALAIVGLVIVVVMTAPRAAGPAAQAGDPPPVTASLQPAVISLEATRVPVPTIDTAYPTTIVGVLPSVVATGTYVWSAPTPDPTDSAEGLHHEYLTNLLYNAPATIVAQGSNTTPVSSTVYTQVTLTTYRVEEVHLPNDETWLTILPHASGGLGAGSVTFNKAWRVTINGTGFYAADTAWFMSANSKLLGVGISTADGLATIVYDRALLPEGTRLGVSFDYGGLAYLPETVHFLPTP
jgi:hypothetical protein